MSRRSSNPSIDSELRDPVCGMSVTPESPHHFKYQEIDYYFCSSGCYRKFKTNPEKYLNPKEEESQDLNAVYTCPMDTEIEQIGPGICPICGMALEPKGVPMLQYETKYTCENHPDVLSDTPGNCLKCGKEMTETEIKVEEKDKELSDMQTRLKVSVLFAVPLFLLSMGFDFFPQFFPAELAPQVIQIILFVLSAPIIFWAGFPFFIRAVSSLRTGKLNMFTLIGVGVFFASAYSILALFAPSVFPMPMISSAGTVPVYFETAGIIITLVLLGQVMELKARKHTNRSIQQLLELSPRKATKIFDDGSEKSIAFDEIQVGDRLRVYPGEKVPVDGVILDGIGFVDESMLTGEPIPQQKEKDDLLIGATLNGEGSFIMKAEKVGADTLFSGIIAIVAEAQRSKAPIQKLVDSVSEYFVPIVMLSAIITFAVWWGFGPEPSLAYALVNAVAVLIIACPCALGLATPLSIMVSVGKSALKGILIKNAESLELLQKTNCIVFDKTGTLTEGRPTLSSVFPGAGFDEREVIRIAAGLSKSNDHPISKALTQGAILRSIPAPGVTDFAYSPGKGICGKIEGKEVLVGNQRHMLENSVDLLNVTLVDDLVSTFVYLAIDGEFAAAFGISDPLKIGAGKMLQALGEKNIEVHLLTGDNKKAAEKIAKTLGIQNIRADVIPEEKADYIKMLKNQGKVVTMVGDGINDSPALAVADVQIAMGNGSDIAIETSGIILIKGNPEGVLNVFRISLQTFTNIRQNLFFAFVYNALGIPIAAGVLYPMFGILLSPMIAALAMSLSSVSVILNSLRLRKI